MTVISKYLIGRVRHPLVEKVLSTYHSVYRNHYRTMTEPGLVCRTLDAAINNVPPLQGTVWTYKIVYSDDSYRTEIRYYMSGEFMFIHSADDVMNRTTIKRLLVAIYTQMIDSSIEIPQSMKCIRGL